MVYHDGKRQWKRSEIGVRVPDDTVCLLASSSTSWESLPLPTTDYWLLTTDC